MLGDRLGAEDEGETSIASQLDSKSIIGHRLHDSRDEGDIEANTSLLSTSEAYQWSSQCDILWGALTSREPRDKEVFPEGAGYLIDEYSHSSMLSKG